MKRILTGTTLTLLAVVLTAGLWITLQPGVASARPEFIRWDIVSVAPPVDFDIDPGGVSTARDLDGNPITLTGSGTFVASGRGKSSAVTGGGTWDTGSASGTYEVTRLVSWIEGPGSVLGSPLNDNIGNAEDFRAGLAVLGIEGRAC